MNNKNAHFFLLTLALCAIANLFAAQRAMPATYAGALADSSLSAFTPLCEIAGNDTTCSIFVYSPDYEAGLRVACLTDREQWQDLGQLCSSCYAAQAGGEKMMLNPYVCHAADGTWRLLFGVNDDATCFGAAYSEDLVTWRPQDFPQLREKGISEPVMFQMDDSTFDIYVKAGDGTRRYVKGDKDFRRFDEAAEASSISDDAWIMDTATVKGKVYDGNLFEVPKIHLDYIMHYLAAIANDKRLNSETMKDDSKRFAGLDDNINVTLAIDQTQEKTISDKPVGVSLQNMSHAADGGLYAELVQDGDFEKSPVDSRGLKQAGAWLSNKPISIRSDNPMYKDNPHYAVLAKGDTLCNKGWDGIIARPLEQYDFSVYLRVPNGSKNQILVSLKGEDGEAYAKEKIKVQGNGWIKYTIPLFIDKKVGKGNVSLALTTLKDGSVDIDMVSLFPHETYKGHGLRKDLCDAIAALRPGIVRFPGCGIDNHQTRNSGFFGFLQFCEDIGAEPMPVLASGDSSRKVLDMIEWANGDAATSRLAKMRAEAGHTAPFNLKYISIGDKDAISTTFEEQALKTAKAVRERYPDITVCCTSGLAHYPSADYTEGWKFANANRNVIDMVDEHYYETPGWFMHHQDYYDNYDRHGPKVSLGGWSSHGMTMEDGLAEALYLCSLERNADVVAMSCYAPLLCNKKCHDQASALIYFDNDTINTLTPSYHTQLLWATHWGSTYIKSDVIPSISKGGHEKDTGVSCRIGASAVKNKDGKVIIKIVNALPSRLTVTVNGLEIPDSTLAEGFKGMPQSRNAIPYKTNVYGNKVTMDGYSVVVIEK